MALMTAPLSLRAMLMRLTPALSVDREQEIRQSAPFQ
jgi:hypothetical protein